MSTVKGRWSRALGLKSVHAHTIRLVQPSGRRPNSVLYDDIPSGYLGRYLCLALGEMSGGFVNIAASVR